METGSKYKVLEDFYLSDELLIYFILFILMSLGVIWANRYFTENLEGSFKDILRYASISSYIFITNIAIYYFITLLIFGIGLNNTYIVVIGYYAANLILYTLLLFMILYILVVFYYFRLILGLFRK